VTGQESVAIPLRGAESGLLVESDTNPGPLVVVDASTTYPDEADWLADMEATKAAATVDGYIGLGHVLRGDPYAPDGMWQHVYATTQPTALAAALTALEATDA
jgi:hypothetical protein